MFRVYDNGRPARYPECRVDPSWNTYQFDAWGEALSYALHWLGITAYGSPLELGIEYHYNGYGDTILIKEEP